MEIYDDELVSFLNSESLVLSHTETDGSPTRQATYLEFIIMEFLYHIKNLCG